MFTLTAEDKAWEALIDDMMEWHEAHAYTLLRVVNRDKDREFDRLYRRVCDLSNRPASVATANMMRGRFETFVFTHFGEVPR